MSDLSQQNTESTVIAEDTDVSIHRDTHNKSQRRITTSALQNIHSLPPIREKKILNVRQQLAEGAYDIDRRLNAVLDRILEDILV